MFENAFRLFVFASLLIASPISATAVAQDAPSINYTSFEASPGRPVQLGFYGAFHKDCSLAPLPTLRVSEAPKLGTLTIRPGQLTTSAKAQCPGLKVRAEVAFYQARAGATGTDHLVYEVVTESHQINAYDVTITIEETAKPTAPPSDNHL